MQTFSSELGLSINLENNVSSTYLDIKMQLLILPSYMVSKVF